MISWQNIFGSTSLDSVLNKNLPAGEPFYEIDNLKRKLLELGWVEWIDPASGLSSVISNDVKIWQGASVRNSVLCTNVIIGHCSEVVECIILDYAKLNHYVAVGRSIIGPYSNLTSHVVVASNRLDQKEVRMSNGFFKSKSPGFKKFGAIIGKNVSIGAFSLINPGSYIPPETTLMPFTKWPIK